MGLTGLVWGGLVEGFGFDWVSVSLTKRVEEGLVGFGGFGVRGLGRLNWKVLGGFGGLGLLIS